MLVDDRPVDLANLPSKGLAVIEFIFKDNNSSIKIPFTEIELAAKWQQYLQQEV